MRRPPAVALALVALLAGCGGDLAVPGQESVRVTPPSTASTVPKAHETASTSTTTPPWVLTLRQAQVLIAVAHAQARSTTTTVSPVMAVESPLPADGDYHAWPDWHLWRAVGLCEQGAARGGPWDSNGDGIAWHGSPAGGLPGSAYPGGLGLSRDFWRMFRAEAGVAQENGALASPGEQIRVARVGSHNGTRMRGWSSWPTCIKNHGG